MLLDILTSRVISDVWSHPDADRQYVFKPVQLSDSKGRIDEVVFPYYSHVRFPILGRRYMVYHVGQIDPRRLGIQLDLWAWAPLTDLTDETGTIFQFFINHRQFNIDGMWITRTHNNSLLLLVEYIRHKELFDFDYEPYFRVYTSSYYAQADESYAYPVYNGRKLTTVSDKSNWLTALSNQPANEVLAFYDGYLIPNNLTPSELALGKSVHFWRDETLLGMFETPLQTARYYQSSENQTNYYILQNTFLEHVHYLDDVEFYLIGTKTFLNTSREVGVYLPRLEQVSMVNLSHCDYALKSDYVDAVIAQHNGSIDFSNGKIRCYVRRNDEQKPVVGDGAMLKHLYRLDAETRVNFMTGSNAGIPFWEADYLESNPYTVAMRESNLDISLRIDQGTAGLRDIYSYFGVLDVLEKNNKDDEGYILFSPMDVFNAVYLSFDEYGTLTGFHERDLGVPSNRIIDQGGPANEKYLSFAGKIVDVSEINVYDPADDYITDYNEVRYYEPSPGVYSKALEGASYTVHPTTKKVTWSAGLAAYDKFKRSAESISINEYTISRNDIGEIIDISMPGVEPADYHEFGFANFEIWVNNRHMVKDIDYVLDYPQLRIRHLEYLPNNNSSFNLVVLRHGLPVNGDQPYPERETGWITNGELSRNNHFDFYLDAVPYIFIGGRYVETTEIKSAETGDGAMPAWVEDGMPYSIIPRIQHSNGEFIRDVTDGRTDAYSKLETAENAVGLVLPQPAPDGEISINEQYSLVSTLINRLVRDLDDNTLIVEESLTTAAVAAIIGNGYSEYLNNDMAQFIDHFDYVVYLPTSSSEVITLNNVEYAFISQVNELYFDGRVTLNAGLAIS